jgi:hypothetical protein
MKITLYKVEENPLEVRPGIKKRQWMDDTVDSYAYRCLPLTIANCTGWDFLAPCDFIIHWNGSDHKDGLTIEYYDDTQRFADSSFGYGIATFHTGYLVRTSEGVDTYVTGPPNTFYDYMAPCSGVVETYWLPFTFTMNWKLYYPGSYHFNKGDSLAFIFPIQHEFNIETEIKDISENKKLEEDFNVWSGERMQFIETANRVDETQEKINNIDPDIPSSQWEKTYYTGHDRFGKKEKSHVISRKFPHFSI